MYLLLAHNHLTSRDALYYGIEQPVFDEVLAASDLLPLSTVPVALDDSTTFQKLQGAAKPLPWDFPIEPADYDNQPSLLHGFTHPHEWRVVRQ